ncbi:MAG: hypothetical protein EU535_03090 [Promethearchaeota archaeon]|nr:MAG: hypothetical protein EU535_03090 [Candidatus Lokiarchaeota archaeon]
MATWRDILNFEVINSFIQKLTGIKIDEELKERGFSELENKYSDEEIYEKEATEIEEELIKIYLDLLEEKGVKIKKRIRLPSPNGGLGIPSGMVDARYVKKLLEELLDEEEDDDDYESDDDRSSDMYI